MGAHVGNMKQVFTVTAEVDLNARWFVPEHNAVDHAWKGSVGFSESMKRFMNIL